MDRNNLYFIILVLLYGGVSSLHDKTMALRLESMENMLNRQSKLNRRQDSMISEMNQKLLAQEREISELKKYKERYRRLLVGSTPGPTASKSAFYAYMNHHELHPGNHQTLIFDSSITNIDGSFSPITGVWTSQVDGLYAFSYSVRMSPNSIGAYEIVHNNQVVGALYINSHGGEDMVTENVVIHAARGDKVFIRVHPTTTVSGIIYSDYNGRTSFSSFLLYAD